MHYAIYSEKLLRVAEIVHRWLGQLALLDAERREKLAIYAEKISLTLGRAADALNRLDKAPADDIALYQALRELGQIAGYLETFVAALEHHLDGRKLAGVKRRLEQLDAAGTTDALMARRSVPRIDRLISAEGYFRALADGLRL